MVTDDSDGAHEQVRMTAVVHGHVQGVGFRAWTRDLAGRLGLAGHVRNLSGGGVEVVAEGSRDTVERMLDSLRTGSDRPGRVDDVTVDGPEPSDGGHPARCRCHGRRTR